MSEQIVIGLFETWGDAEDVGNRLKYEGVPSAAIQLRLLRKTEPIPPSMAPETHPYAIDFIYGTTVLEKYLKLIRNGETAVCVRARSEEEAEVAVSTMRLFAPIAVEEVSPSEEELALREEQQAPLPGASRR